MPLGIGPLELAIVLLIVLVIFGPKRLPGLGRSIGTGMREFKDSITSKTRRDEEEDDSESPAIGSAQVANDAPDTAAGTSGTGNGKAQADEPALDGEVVPERRV